MLRNIVEGLKSLSITTLKAGGFGLSVISARDQFFEDNPMNFIATAIGAVCWMTGTYLEIRRPQVVGGYVRTVEETCCESTSRVMKELDSTSVMKQVLSHTGGVGVATGLVNFAKGHDTVSANVSNLSMGLFMPTVINELTWAENCIIPPLKWEKLRFVVLVGADYLSAAGMKKLMNGDAMNLFDIFSIPVGMLASGAEFYYSIKNDVGLNLANAINRRTFKLTGALNFIFTLIDFVEKNTDKYTISDDVYSLMTGSLMFAVIYQLRQLSKRYERLQEQQQEMLNQLERYSVLINIQNGFR